MIEFLDQLRHSLAHTYADDIQKRMREEQEEQSDQIKLPFDDPVDFKYITMSQPTANRKCRLVLSLESRNILRRITAALLRR